MAKAAMRRWVSAVGLPHKVGGGDHPGGEMLTLNNGSPALNAPRSTACSEGRGGTRRSEYGGAHPIAITVHIVDGFGIPGALAGIEAVCALGE
jgi:hypothetical protein